jgi:hypothetical protein
VRRLFGRREFAICRATFSAHLGSLEVLQLLSMVVAPHGISNPGVQAHHFVVGSLDQDWPICLPTCRYSAVHLARGDAVAPGIVNVHEVAATSRDARSPTYT